MPVAFIAAELVPLHAWTAPPWGSPQALEHEIKAGFEARVGIAVGQHGDGRVCQVGWSVRRQGLPEARETFAP